MPRHAPFDTALDLGAYLDHAPPLRGTPPRALTWRSSRPGRAVHRPTPPRLNTATELGAFLPKPAPGSALMVGLADLPLTFDWRRSGAHRDRGALLGATPNPKDWTTEARSLGPVLNQGSCGSCWAVSATSILTDYFRLFGGAHERDLVLSPLPLLDPNMDWGRVTYGTDHTPVHPPPQGCVGMSANVNNPGAAFLYGQQVGLPRMCQGSPAGDCVAYDFTRCCASEDDCEAVVKGMYASPSTTDHVVGAATTSPACQTCQDGGGGCGRVAAVTAPKAPTLHRLPARMQVVGVTRHPGATGDDLLRQMKMAITKYGPILTASLLPSDFATDRMVSTAARGGIYKPPAGQTTAGGHAMAVVGWGRTKAGQEYLTFRNSWGPDWADKGFFRWDAHNYVNGSTLQGSQLISFAYIVPRPPKKTTLAHRSAPARTSDTTRDRAYVAALSAVVLCIVLGAVGMSLVARMW